MYRQNALAVLWLGVNAAPNHNRIRSLSRYCYSYLEHALKVNQLKDYIIFNNAFYISLYSRMEVSRRSLIMLKSPMGRHR